MPNQLELELNAIHSTIAEIKRQMKSVLMLNTMKHYKNY